MSKNYTISIEEEYNRKWELIAKHEYSDKSKLLRKWIDQNYKEEYSNDFIIDKIKLHLKEMYKNSDKSNELEQEKKELIESLEEIEK